MKAPTAKQLAVLNYLRAHLATHGFQPSFAEMAERFDYKSQNSIHEHLMWLERKGMIVRGGQKSRAIVITDAGSAA